jgi:tetratricopeptide (TPR) repeat protein
MNLNKILKNANKLFDKKNYQEALKLYSIVLNSDKDNVDARAGVLLSSLDKEFYNEIPSLYELFTISKILEPEYCIKNLELLIKSIEENKNTRYNGDVDLLLDMQNAITYSDFKKILGHTDNKKTLEGIFFATKILIRSKDDFFDFINILIDNSYYELANSYLDEIVPVYPYDKKLQDLYKKILRLKSKN